MIKYKEGYKYQLVEPYSFNIGRRVNDALALPGPWQGASDLRWQPNDFVTLCPTGKVIVKAGYAWDGASGPTWDDETNMVPALEHDVIYQLIRQGILPDIPYRKLADDRFYQGIKSRGMNAIRAWYYYRAVRRFGKKANKKRKIFVSE